MKIQPLSSEIIEDVIHFHGHWCPGLALGIRVAQIALAEIGHSSDEEIVAICETDMCGVDAIQFLTGCTLGKGNLIIRPYGKMAFSFYRRKDGKSIRVVLKNNGKASGDIYYRELQEKMNSGTITEKERETFAKLRFDRCHSVLNAPIEEFFIVEETRETVPPPAPMTGSVKCCQCGEGVMETKSRFFKGEFYCLPCFEKFIPRP
ncbi:MAG TPA: hypothetical protein DEP01_01860 [Aminobacterium sp.]|jgi:formylmethanofuran dehydrogenase subunit E|uniref:FmdE family protein n=1 Tax=Aminobacterium TaxID=81466 RepID=UPI000EEA824E|nr:MULTISPECIES: FmdE family protein [unclassified Aminobacterium]HCA40362.1 hypothetical protein [Aminobacterium sp.]